jgi:hypothetical protein
MRLSRYWVAMTSIGLAFVAVGLISRFAVLTVALDAVRAVLILTPAALAGLWLVPLFRCGDLPLRWHVLIGTSLGIGLLSLLVLLLGWAGCLTRTNWLVWLSALFVIGLIRIPALPLPSRGHGLRPYPWLLLVPFLVLALLAAANAPGSIWSEEGYGYDVLEYHLQMPKEYAAAGRIAYAPHNVYASFPANVEMLYLLAMVVLDEDIDVGTTANTIHLCLGLLAVFAAWVIGCDWSNRAGLLCALALGTTGWLMYLSGLAYVENGTLLFGISATGAMLRAVRGATDASPDTVPPNVSRDPSGWIALSGLLAGLACGCKYTAVPFIGLPVIVMTALVPGRLPRRVKYGALVVAAVAVTFAPWLVKNHFLTGNPTFPLANAVFHAEPPGWTAQSAEQWDRAHRPPPQEQSLGRRFLGLWQAVAWDHYQRFGPAIFLIPLGGLFVRRCSRVDLGLLLMLCLQVAIWLLATHLYARFAVVLLIPLVLLAGRAVSSNSRRWCWPGALTLLALGGAWNFGHAASLCRREAAQTVPAFWFTAGTLPGYEHYGIVNNDLPADAKVLLIGDARAFYYQRTVDYFVVFNENPFVDAVRQASAPVDVLRWLQDHRYTHILVHWGEVQRLSATYGFSPVITSALFDELNSVGVQRVTVIRSPGTSQPYAELLSVPALGPRGRDATGRS